LLSISRFLQSVPEGNDPYRNFEGLGNSQKIKYQPDNHEGMQILQLCRVLTKRVFNAIVNQW